MPNSDSGQSSSKFKNYVVNTLILLLALVTIYMMYSLIRHTTSSKPDVRKEIIDSASEQITKQPSGSTLQIDVQNGSGVQGIANKFTDYLREKGYDVVEMGNFSTSDIKTSMVIDRAGNMRNAKKVARSLGISEKYVIQQINKNYFLDATVVIGKDYMDLKPLTQTQNNK